MRRQVTALVARYNSQRRIRHWADENSVGNLFGKSSERIDVARPCWRVVQRGHIWHRKGTNDGNEKVELRIEAVIDSSRQARSIPCRESVPPTSRSIQMPHHPAPRPIHGSQSFQGRKW